MRRPGLAHETPCCGWPHRSSTSAPLLVERAAAHWLRRRHPGIRYPGRGDQRHRNKCVVRPPARGDERRARGSHRLRADHQPRSERAAGARDLTAALPRPRRRGGGTHYQGATHRHRRLGPLRQALRALRRAGGGRGTRRTGGGARGFAQRGAGNARRNRYRGRRGAAAGQ